MTIRIGYFASLRDACGLEDEILDVKTQTVSDLYERCATVHRFPLARQHLRVAVNDAFADWNHLLKEGDFVVFIPPVAGG
jgi:molybdopterin converting factor subunit 1